jgi:hypothetical protein
MVYFAYFMISHPGKTSAAPLEILYGKTGEKDQGVYFNDCD